LALLVLNIDLLVQLTLTTALLVKLKAATSVLLLKATTLVGHTFKSMLVLLLVVT
jgi:hypothetical protein